MTKIKGWKKREDIHSPVVGRIQRWDSETGATSVSIVSDEKWSAWWIIDVYDYQGIEMGKSRDKEFIRKQAINYMK